MRALVGLVRTMRPRQWTKNGIIYAGIVFDGQLLVWDSFLRVTIAFFLLCLIAGSVYIINDLVDIERDRQHPTKQFRPLPSGQLPASLAVAVAVILPLLCVSGAVLLSGNWRFAFMLVAYLVLQILYSFLLKHIVIVDVMAITAGFVLRVGAGVLVIEVSNFSPWLYACSALLAMFLAVGKRRQELLLLAENAVNVRSIYKDYNLPLLDDMMRILLTSTLITYILYTIEAPTIKVANTNSALLTVPFVMYALFRYLYLIHVRGEGAAPDEVLLTDRPLQLAILCWGITFVVILYMLVGTSVGSV